MDPTATPRLNERQRAIVWLTAAAVALTRLLAVSKSLWDWDEALFCSALREFNVAFTAHGVEYHPHPPGFPLFILAGHVMKLFTSSEFRALQMVSVLAAMLLVPLMFALARAVRMTFAEAMSAALLLAFLPNVWFYGGTAFSDVPALAAILGAAAALFGSRSGDRRLYLAGCLLLGISIGFRPQNVLVGAYPWLAASWQRRRGRTIEIAAGAAIVIGVAVAAYGGAALASDSTTAYLTAVREHEHYVTTVDSFRNPSRAGLVEVFRIFVLDPFHARKAMYALWVLAAIGALSFRRPAVEALLTFGPFLVFAWLMLDTFGASRLSIGFIPLPALLVPCGVSLLMRVVRAPAGSPAPHIVVAGAFVAYFAWWTLPALRDARMTDAPPVAASRWIRQHVDRAGSRLYVDNALAPQAEFFLRDYSQVLVDPDFPARGIDPRNRWVITEGATVLDGSAISFRRPRARLWNIVRHRYFEVVVVPLTNWVTFGEGWHDGESYDLDVWRWMGKHSVTWLPAIDRKGELRLRGHFPLESLPRPPVVTIAVNGGIVDRFSPSETDIDRSWVVATRDGQPNELTIDVDEVLNLARAGVNDDSRELGFQLKGLAWRLAR